MKYTKVLPDFLMDCQLFNECPNNEIEYKLEINKSRIDDPISMINQIKEILDSITKFKTYGKYLCLKDPIVVKTEIEKLKENGIPELIKTTIMPCRKQGILLKQKTGKLRPKGVIISNEVKKIISNKYYKKLDIQPDKEYSRTRYRLYFQNRESNRIFSLDVDIASATKREDLNQLKIEYQGIPFGKTNVTPEEIAEELSHIVINCKKELLDNKIPIKETTMTKRKWILSKKFEIDSSS